MPNGGSNGNKQSIQNHFGRVSAEMGVCRWASFGGLGKSKNQIGWLLSTILLPQQTREGVGQVEGTLTVTTKKIFRLSSPPFSIVQDQVIPTPQLPLPLP